MMSKGNLAILEAVKKGYTIDERGCVFKNGKCLKLYSAKTGYYSFGIRMFNKQTFNISVHRFQAYFKYGDEIFEKGKVVRHLNNDSKDNSFSNIGIGTQQDNCLDNPKKDRVKYAINAVRVYQESIRSKEERYKIYNDLYSGMSYNKVMAKYNISSKGTVSFMKNKSLEYQEFLANI